MSSRERILMLVVGTLVILIGGGAGGMFWYKKQSEARARIAKAESEIRKKEDAIAREEREQDRIHALSPRLTHWRRQSLPEAETGKDPEVHLSRMHHAYQQYLTDVLNDNGFLGTVVTPGKFDNKQTPQFAKDKPVYGVKVYTVAAHANLKSVIKVFEAMHKMPVLHQVKHFKLSRPPRGTDQLKEDELKIAMTIEVLSVTGAERMVSANTPEGQKKDARTDWITKYDNSSKRPAVLAVPVSKPPRNYEDMVAKHLFNLNPPKVEPIKGPERTKDPDPPMVVEDKRPREKLEDVLTFVRLTGIDYTEGIVDQDENPEQPDVDTGWAGAGVSYNVFRTPQWEATLINLNRSNVEEATGKTTLDVARFRMIHSTKRMRVPDFQILDKYNNLALKGEGIRIEDRSLLVLIDKKIYRIHLGASLQDAMQKPLEEKELVELGLAQPKEPEKKPYEQMGPFKPEAKKEPDFVGPMKPEEKKEPSKVDEKKEPAKDKKDK